jgi:hypothetical protein
LFREGWKGSSSCSRQSWSRLPGTPRTVPDVRFSRIRFLGRTRLRVKRVLSSVSSPTDFGYTRPGYLYPVENLVELRPGETLPLATSSIEPFVCRLFYCLEEVFQRPEVSSHSVVIVVTNQPCNHIKQRGACFCPAFSVKSYSVSAVMMIWEGEIGE